MHIYLCVRRPEHVYRLAQDMYTVANVDDANADVAVAAVALLHVIFTFQHVAKTIWLSKSKTDAPSRRHPSYFLQIKLAGGIRF